MRKQLRSVYLNVLPKSSKEFFRTHYLNWSAKRIQRRYPGDQCQCNFCGFKAAQFLPGGYDEPVLIEKNVIGGGRRTNARCPKCFSLDRERQIATVLDGLKLDTASHVLHVAPEKNLNLYLRTRFTSNVLECDLKPESYDWAQNMSQQDLTALTFANNSLDLIVCNHVLEHIPDDASALKESFRVLKPGGYAVIHVPYSDTISDTEEDLENFDPTNQLKKFGQVTHVRLYAKSDYIRRATSVGFIDRFQAHSSMGEYANRSFDKREGIFLFQKPL